MRIGPAGWSYPDWEGRVYPRSKPRGFHALAFLARFVDCVEINSTFYAQPRAEHARHWVDLVADHPGFRFTLKLLREFTHSQPVDDAFDWEAAAQQFQEGIAPIVRAGRLGAVLVQFPASFLHGPSQVRRIGRIRTLLDGLPLVLEVRHRSWFEPPALDVVRGLGYSLAYVDLPPAWNHPPEWHPPTGPVGYLRLHGRNSREWFRRDTTRDDRYDYLYAPKELRELVSKGLRIEHESRDTYVVTNNHYGGQALANALEIRFLTQGTPVPAPAELVRSFPHLTDITRPEGQGELFG